MTKALNVENKQKMQKFRLKKKHVEQKTDQIALFLVSSSAMFS